MAKPPNEREPEITFEDLIAAYDPDNVLGYEEQLECYYAEKGSKLVSAAAEIELEDRDRASIWSNLAEDESLTVKDMGDYHLYPLHMSNYH